MLKNLQNIFLARDSKVLLLYVVLLSVLVREFLLWRPFKYTNFIDIVQNREVPKIPQLCTEFALYYEKYSTSSDTTENSSWERWLF